MHPPTCYKPEWRYKLHIDCLLCKSWPLLENPTFTRFIWAAQRILKIHLNRKQMVSESWNEEGKGRSWTTKLTLSESYHDRSFRFWRQGITPISFVACYASKIEVLKVFLKRQLNFFFIWEKFNNKLQVIVPSLIVCFIRRWCLAAVPKFSLSFASSCTCKTPCFLIVQEPRGSCLHGKVKEAFTSETRECEIL